MRRGATAAVLAAVVASPVAAQQARDQTTVIDSIAVSGNQRTSRAAVLAWAGIATGEPLSFRDIQRAIAALYGTGQFADVTVYQGTVDGKQVLQLVLVERPLVASWTVRGVAKLPERKVRGRVTLLAGRPFDPAAAARSRAAIDSLYQEEGYYLTAVEVRQLPQQDGSLRVVFDVDEGRRVTVSQVFILGNRRFADARLADQMQTKPEGFWWFQRGTYNEDKLERDLRERLPNFYGSHGFVDFQVLHDSLVIDPSTGKGVLKVVVDEGEQYRVGSFDMLGNRYFSSEQLERLFPFGGRATASGSRGGADGGSAVFDRLQWEQATQQVQTLYANNGYIYARINPVMSRRRTAAGEHLVDLRWQIIEGNPAVVNKVLIRGNTVTHEDVIRRALLMVPGDVMRQEALIRSYQNITNIGFFQQPLATPSIEQVNERGDVNVTFHVEERHTGNVNFGASVGQGTGLGGFIGLTEPNLLGRGKRISFQWQFGRHINDFNVSYTDPAIRGSFISGTISLHNSRLRYTVADLGRIRSRGGSLQFGFPISASRFTQLLASYTLEQSQFDSPTLRPRFACENCVLSSLGLSMVRDTRIELPFPTGGALHRVDLSQGGGVLAGSGNFRRMTFEGRWYAPLGTLGESGMTGSPMKLVLGLSGQLGFVWGDPGPHFRQLFTMGGTQFGIPLRGYDEFSVTPEGFDPQARGFRAGSVNAFGRSYLVMTTEVGLRLSQAIYASTFFDGGNVWATPERFNPTRLFRGAGVGLSLITPLGPIGLDYAYGFDRTDQQGNPKPGWKFHFRLGNLF